MAKEEVAKVESVAVEVMPDYTKFGLPQVADPFARLDQLVEISNVETWDFELSGDVAGLVLAKVDRYHDEFGRYPYLTLQLQNADVVGVACVGHLLTQAADRANVGDLIAFRKNGKVMNREGTREYNSYGVAVIPKGEHNVGVQAEQPF